MSRRSTIDVIGLDEFGQRILAWRWRVCCIHLRRWLILWALWDSTILTSIRRKELVQRLELLQRKITCADSDDFTTQKNGQDIWYKDYLLPLARDLRIWKHMYRHVWDKTFRQCWSHDLFSYARSDHKPFRITKPDYETCRCKVQALFCKHTSQSARIDALVKRPSDGDLPLCSDTSLAASAVQRLGNLDEESALAAWNVLYRTLSESSIELLRFSTYPCTTELLQLQRYATIIDRMADDPHVIMKQLRTTLIALYRTLTAQPVIHALLIQNDLPTTIPNPLPEKLTQSERLRYQHACKVTEVGFWREDLLHRPRFDPERTTYRAQLTSELLNVIQTELQTKYPDDAERLVAALYRFVDNGIAGLIDTSCNISGGQTAQTFLMYRIRDALDRHLDWLPAIELQTIEWLLICLQETIDALKLPIPLFPLVDTYPGNPCRKRFKEWLKTEPQIITQFAQRARLVRKDASARLYAFGSYGGLGIRRFREEELYQVVPQHIVHYIHFLKLAHTNEHLDLSLVLSRVNELVAPYGKKPFSPQVIRAIFNRLKKEKHANVGSGETTDPFYVRPSVNLPNVPRLFKAWVLVLVKLAMTVTDARTSEIHQGCYCLLVLDHDGVIPMGCWISLGPPTTVEVGLCVYQAIWHLGNVWWPLKGVPESIQVPLNALQLRDDQLGDLNRATHFMLSEVIATDREGYWRKQRIVRQCAEEVPAAVRKAVPNSYATCQQIQAVVLSWLYNVRLEQKLGTNERDVQIAEMDEQQDNARKLSRYRETTDLEPLYGPSLNTQRAVRGPSSLWNRGFALPGYDSPAAGWLLPRGEGNVITTTDGVLLGSNRYEHPILQTRSGLSLPYRVFPYQYPTIERGIFVEYQNGLQYFTRSDECKP